MRPGYKQTEWAVIPEDWDDVQISDVRPFVTSGSRGWAPFYSERGSLFVRITNLSRDTIYIDLSDSKFVRLPPGLSECDRTQLRLGDVLISITADIGIIGYVDSRVPSSAFINQHIALIRFDSSKINGKFVAYFLASENPQKRFRASTDTGAKAGVNLSTVQAIRIALPSLSEQSAIASALSDVDALLAGLDRLITKKRDLKQAAMQQLLTGKVRLPGFKGDWEARRLGEVVKFEKGQLITEGSAILGPIPVIAGGKKPAYFHNRSNRTGKTITISASGASAGYVAFFNEPIFASDCTTIGESEDYSIEFVYFLLQWKQSAIYTAQTGGAQPHVHASDISPIELFWPAVPEQIAIASILSDMDAEISALETQRDKTRALKQGMMQELLTGRTRLVRLKEEREVAC